MVTAGVAATLVLVIMLSFFRSDFVRLSQRDPLDGYSISEWEPLTDSLLELPCDQLLRTVPRFDYLALETGHFPSEQNRRSNGSAL
jgi:hypothetical protein